MERIYFVGNEHGVIKIGYTGITPKRRLHQLQIASADKLTLLGVLKGNIRDEAKLHSRFSHLHIRGEWFEATESLMDFIQLLPEANLERVKKWRRVNLTGDIVSRDKELRALSEAKTEAKQIIEDARQAANEIIDETLDLVKKYAAIEIKELTSTSLNPLFFDCRCCRCGQASPTVKERDDGLPWCNICWVNHAIFDTGRFDAIVSSASEEVLLPND